MNPFASNADLTTKSHAAPIEPTDSVLVQSAKAGATQALDSLISRHWPAFLHRAHLACGDATAAEDVCQEACLKAIHDISHLSNPERFRSWVLRFIDHAAMHWKRNLKKDCTRTDEIGPYIVETMSAKSVNQSQQDMRVLLDLLSERISGMTSQHRRAGAYMLDHYRERNEFPTIRAIASATHTSQGAAKLHRDEVLASWCRFLASVELGLPIRTGAAA